jgi:hypothetical protein
MKTGDLVKVIDSGRTYTTHMGMAHELEADYWEQDYKDYTDRKRHIQPTPKKYKFKYNEGPQNGDIGIIKNIVVTASSYILFERHRDHQQFILDAGGLQKQNHALPEELFEI